jgi:addiction module RelE/StbE family toxin
MISKIIWSKRSLRQFKKLYEYIKEESPKGADKVREAIITTSEKLKTTPLMFEADRFKTNNNGAYRAFTEFDFRVTYKVKANRIIILKIIHTSQKPKDY